MIDFSRTMNLFFWFSWSFSIVMTLSSTISARKTNTFFSLFISKKRVNTLSFLINFFIVNNRFFNTFIAFFKSSKTIESWMTFVAILTIFFAKAETFENIFFLNCANFLLIRINSKERKAIKNDDSSLWKKRIEKTTKDERICRLLKSTNEKSKRFRASNMIKFENSVTATEFSKTNEKVSRIKKTVLTIFFIDLIIDLIVFFFDWMIFFCLRLILLTAAKATSKFEQFAILRSNTEQNAHRLFSKAKKLNIHSILFFRQYKQRVSSFWLFKLYVLRIVFKWIALCAFDCRYSNQI